MSLSKKSLRWSLATLSLILLVLFVLERRGFFEDPAVALRELEKAGVAATDAEVRKAVAANDLVLVERLGRAGVDFRAPDEAGRSVLHSALVNDRAEVLPLLDRYGIEVNQPDGSGKLPLEEALEKEGDEWAEEFLKRGAEIDFAIAGIPAPLVYYDAERWTDLAFLIDHGASPNPVDQDGVSLMARTIKAGDTFWLERLLEAGASIRDGDQALVAQALAMGRADLMIPLLKNGADPNQLLNGGERIINRLCRHWQGLGFAEGEAAAVLSELMKRGADIEALSIQGLRPIQAALRYPFPAGLNLLLPVVDDVSGSLGLAFEHQNWAACKALLERGADPDELIAGEPVLFTMMKAGQIEMVEALISHGASLEILGAEGQRPLATAVAIGNDEITFALLNHDRKPELSAHLEFPVSLAYRDFFGRKGLLDWYCRNERHLQPIMVAVMLRQLEVVERFLELGVDKYSATKNRVYPIQMAANRGDIKMQQLLIGVPYEDDQQVRSFIVDLSEQKVYYYKRGKLIKTSRCSTGSRKFRTPTGKFVITDKTKNKVSNLYRDAKMPYFQRFSCSEIGFHEGPTYAGFLSHGCIRLPMSSAKYFWGQAKIGDRVTIRK